MSNPVAPVAPDSSTLNLSARTRLWIYIVSALVTIVIAYGNAKDWAWLGEAELAAWSSVVALVNVLAATNVSTGTKK